jgi:hypothetical protein
VEHRSAPSGDLRYRAGPERTADRPTTALRALHAVLVGAVYVLWAREIEEVVCARVGWYDCGVYCVGSWYRVRSSGAYVILAS